MRQTDTFYGKRVEQARCTVRNWMRTWLPAWLLGAVAAASLSAQTPPPETIYTNANIHTLDPTRPRAEALAVAGGRIVAVGSRSEVLRLRKPATRVVDLSGQTVLPGLIDAHAHFASLGSYSLGRVDLSYARSFDEVVETIAAQVEKTAKGEWIIGGRWDHERWPGRQLPTHEKLSAVSPDNPVWMTRVDGHVGLANAAAMELAGVTPDTPSPDGGEIIKAADSELTEQTRSRIDVYDLLQKALVAAGTGRDQPAILPLQPDILHQPAAEHSGQFKVDVAVERAVHRRSPDLSIGHIESTVADFPGPSLGRKSQIGLSANQPDVTAAAKLQCDGAPFCRRRGPVTKTGIEEHLRERE